MRQTSYQSLRPPIVVVIREPAHLAAMLCLRVEVLERSTEACAVRVRGGSTNLRGNRQDQRSTLTTPGTPQNPAYTM